MRRSVRKPLTLVACATVVAALLLVVAANVDDASAPPINAARVDLEGIRGPSSLTPQELAVEQERGASSLDSTIGGIPAGGWIQISGPDGQLAQQYRFERLDPDPENKGAGWINMSAPEFEVYGSGGSVIVLSGDTALAFAPESAVESGTLSGNVLIRRYDHPGPGPLDRARQEPSLVVLTDEAVFDNILGEVRCDGWIRLETNRAEFNGRQLSLLLNDKLDIIQRLDIEQVDSIRFAEAAPGDVDPGSRPAGAPEAAPEAVGVNEPAPVRAARAKEERGAAASSPPPAGSEAPAEAPARTPKRPQFYRVTLYENVRIEQVDGDAARTATGDELSVVFSSESEGLGDVLSLVPLPAAPDRDRLAFPGRVQPLTEILLASALALTDGPARLIAPPPAPGDVMITCDGGLTMVPLNPKRSLDSPADARLSLVGAPVRIEDEAASTVATCARVQYDLKSGRLELLGDETHALDIASPQLDAHGERFWIVERDDLAGFTGPGTAVFLEPAENAPARERLRIDWSDRVDLAFAADSPGSSSRLERAVFAGNVRVASADLQLEEMTGGGDATPDEPPTDGRLSCRELAIEFRPAATTGVSPAGDRTANIEPSSLRAAGAVVVDDGSRMLRAGTLDAWFADDAGDTETDLERLVAVSDVQLRLAGGERIYADRLDVDGGQRTAVLSGREVRLVDGPNVLDRAELITLDERARRYTLVGKGRLRRFDQAIFAPGADDVGATMFDHVEGRTEELRITWHEGVEFLGGGDGTALGPDSAGLARFTGDVVVVSPELRLTHADELVVRFADEEAGPVNADAAAVSDPDGGIPSRRIESITARGDVRARSAGDEGEIRAEHLLVELSAGADGATVPTKLVAAGGVHVADAQQQIWTEVLTATFRAVAEGDRAADAAPDDFSRARVAVDTVTTEGGVQVLLAAGERAFADRLVASGERETAELLGNRVMVVAGQVVLDECRRLILDRQSGQHRVEGPGIFYQVEGALPTLAADGPVDRPVIDGPRTIEAVWSDSATYTEAEGGGTLELRGNVHGESRPSPLELSTMDAAVVTLEFQDGPPVSGDDPTRELARLVATGDARLENRTWQTPDQQGRPRVFHVAGDRVEYDQRTLEALVLGQGELLIRDEWAVAEPDDGRGLGVGFGSRGTTLFRWNEKLHMRQVVDDRFNIVMNGDVECLHRDLDRQPSTLTGQVLEATVARSGAVEGDGASPPRGGLRLGGSMKPKRLYGRGGIFIRTPERDVTCDEFAYNTVTGMAEVNAAPGRMVFIHGRGSSEPMRHERVLWDMRNDTITIYRGGG